MSKQLLVQIIGVPVACPDGVKDTWRQVAGWAAGQLKARFGEAVVVRYFDLLDTDCPSMPVGAQLPLVMVNAEVVSSGGKISVPAIRRKIEEIMERQTA